MILKMSFVNQCPWGIVFLQLARHWLLFFENHKIDPLVILARPGGMRRGAGGRFEGGLRHLQDLWFGFDTPALLYETGGGFNRYAHSAGPKIIKNRPEAQILLKNAIFDDFEIFENSSKN